MREIWTQQHEYMTISNVSHYTNIGHENGSSALVFGDRVKEDAEVFCYLKK